MTATFCPYCGGWLGGVLHMSPPPPAGHYPWCSPTAGMGRGTTTTSTTIKWLPQPSKPDPTATHSAYVGWVGSRRLDRLVAVESFVSGLGLLICAADGHRTRVGCRLLQWAWGREDRRWADFESRDPKETRRG